METPTLCYWDIRGLAQPIRLLLEYTGTKYQNKMLSRGPAPDFDGSCWTDIKEFLGLDFPNLPYYIDGNVKMTQSNAILRHIGRKHNMVGTTEEEMAKVDMMTDQAMDLRNSIVMLVYDPNYEQLLPDYLKKMTSSGGMLERFSRFLASNEWFVGRTVTIVDFVMYELLDQLRLMSIEFLKPYPNLTAFLGHFEKLPQIETYMKSPRFLKYPINGRVAKFGGI